MPQKRRRKSNINLLKQKRGFWINMRFLIYNFISFSSKVTCLKVLILYLFVYKLINYIQDTYIIPKHYVSGFVVKYWKLGLI